MKSLAIHGGAGTILRSQMTAEKEKAYTEALREALRAGWEVLERNGDALDAVEIAVRSLEDCPLFNAGRGAVFTNDERHELDASIMDGRDLNAGAVAAVSNIKNPVSLARLVMEKSDHVMLAAAGAMDFARQQRVEFASDAYFYTDFRFRQLEEAKEHDRIQLDHTVNKDEEKSPAKEHKFGTVGAVACDARGNLAAATSTGGMTNKKFRRIGDSPIIGAGTYADNATCAVSCTGHGEFFIRGVAAYDVAARLKYKGISLKEAARETIEFLREFGGEGGLIAVDNKGNITLPFNSEGMYRGWTAADGKPHVEIYGSL